MSILQSTFDKHKKLMLEHTEELYEGSLIQNPKFQEDYSKLIDKYKELFLASDTEKVVNDVKSSSPDMFDIYGEYTLNRTVELNLDGKFTIEIKLRLQPEEGGSLAHYDHRTDSIVFVFYKDSKNFSKMFELNENFDIKKFYNQKLQWINSVIGHELSHAYKQRFRSRKHSKAFVKPSDVATGKKNAADYALYDDERESYLAQIWHEMRDVKTQYPDSTFFSAMKTSETFRMTLEAMGGEKEVKPKYKKLYNYFIKKLVEMWKNAGYDIDKVDVNKAVELC